MRLSTGRLGRMKVQLVMKISPVVGSGRSARASLSPVKGHDSVEGELMLINSGLLCMNYCRVYSDVIKSMYVADVDKQI